MAAPSPPATPGGGNGAAKPKKWICYPCKRKFKSPEMLAKHEEVSDLHRDTIIRQEQTLVFQKQTLYASLSAARKQVLELEATMSNSSVLQADDLSDQKAAAEDRLSRCEVTYGLVQEKIEARRRVDDVVMPKAVKGQTFELAPGFSLSSEGMGWWGNKEVQEDRFLLDMVLAHGEVVGYAVLDGHTGSKCVDFMYASVPRMLDRTLSTKPKPISEEHIRQGVKEAIVLLEDEWTKLAKAHDLVDGTTFCLALFFLDKSDVNLDGTRQVRKKVICANVGDSRAILCRNLMPLRLSEDHKPSRESERIRIQEAGGAVTEVNGIHRVFTLSAVSIHGRMMHLGLSVSRSLGDLPLKQPVLLVDSRPEFKSYEITSDDDAVVIACDGVWDFLSEREACLLAEAGKREGSHSAQRIVRRSFEKCSSDNLTAVVVYTHTEAPTKRRKT